MLRPAGYFGELPCPFEQAAPGACLRPHCQYKHDRGSRRETQPPPAAAASTACSSFAGSTSQQALELGKNMQELERINKAIETVKTEMEEKQKKLSRYKQVAKAETPNICTSLSDQNGNQPCCVEDAQPSFDPEGKHNLSLSSSSSKKGLRSVSNKYVVDHSCPATDLEYDPLLNYSADLLNSFHKKEVGNEKSKPKHLKMHTHENRGSSTSKRPRIASPVRLEIKLQESDDDDALVIDAPPLKPMTKKPRLRKKPDWNQREKDSPAACEKNPPKNVLEESLKGIETNGIDNIASGPNGSNDLCKVVEKQQTMSLTQNVSSNVKSNIFTKDLSDTTRSQLSKRIKICSASNVITDTQKVTCKSSDQKCVNSGSLKSNLQNEQTETGHINLCSITSKYDTYQDNSKKKKSQTHTDSRDVDPGKIHTMPGSIKAEILENTCLDETTFLVDQSNGCSSDFCETDAKSNEVLGTNNENEIIVVDSSSEDGVDHDMDVSDSDDPMEECLRIFNEFAENKLKEARAKQVSEGEHTEMDEPDSKAVDKISGQKRRIAHSAKFNVKSSRGIFVPFKGPVPQQICNSRVLQAQHQAAQITADVKSGQAFVAATSVHKKIPGFTAPLVNSVDQIVCVNLLDIQPAVSSRSHSYGVFQGHSIATVACRPIIPLRKTVQMPPPKVITRRRPSVIPEIGSKVPHDTRQRYVNFFVEECLKVCSSVEEAFEKALSEEKAIYDRCGSKNMYLNIAVNTLKKLRDQGGNLQMSRKENNATRSRKHEEKDLTGVSLYKLLKDYALTEEQLEEYGYPRLNPDKPGSAIICSGLTKSFVTDALKKICCRCGEIYSVTSKGKHVRKEECNYHSGRVLKHRVPGGVETRYSCCEAIIGTPGCQVAKLHVHDGQKENLDGFMKTLIKLPPPDGNPGVFALDCEMCYTTQGLDLTRVTVVDSSLQIVYDTYVKPDNEIIDYNTRFSGVSEDDLKNINTSIRDVQAVMLNMFSAETILIGHSLENDLFSLKLIHENVVDTSVVFPHRLGLPHKRALRSLIADYLRRIIQDDDI
ncbi:RNA exonuclease 1 homolog isoform X2 [Rhinatrema bivittatum]|uniref:RNA exonuclease 1 homolog isoform X2 n=1 Tax=Rhinatrema bivittatum TaxID=194408 RepID=UPI00112C268D|nr:RNA exonuclease 1 homolog isoform X2 [Rhinatrema bivittatum]